MPAETLARPRLSGIGGRISLFPRLESPRQLSLEQQVGQLLMVAIPDAELSRETAEFLRRHHIGGVALFYQNARDPWQIARLCADLQAVALENGDPPLLIAIDQEGGPVARLPYPASDVPSAMAVGATRRPDYASVVAEVLAAEVSELGINMNLAPVADVNTEPRNPVIGTRAFGDRPERVAPMVEASIVGHHQHGVLATAKHFPGHGATELDSHLDRPAATGGWAHLGSVDLEPFRTAIRAGVDAICTAHVAYPMLGDNVNGNGSLDHPATFSSLLLDYVLRQRLGFQGLVVSDALEMDAVALRYGPAEAALLAIQAGVDVALLIGARADQAAAYQALLEAAGSGPLAGRRLEAASRRVLAAKASLVSPPAAIGLWPKEAHRWRIRQVARASITLVRDRQALVPLRLDPDQRLGVVEFLTSSASPVEAAGRPPTGVSMLDALVRSHHARTESVLVRTDSAPRETELRAFVETCDLVLLATRDAWFEPAQAELARRLLESGRPIILAALRSPYDLAVLPQAETALCTYGDPSCSVEALVDGLFGAFDPTGRLPVSVPGLAVANLGESAGSDSSRVPPG